MILWHDSLYYRSSTQLSLVYPAISGCTVTASHEQITKRSVGISGNSLLSPPAIASTNLGAETAFIGFRLGVTAMPAGVGPLLKLRSSGGVVLATVQVFTSGPSKLRLQVMSGEGVRLLARSPEIDIGTSFLYVELKIKTAVNGIVELRVNGNRIALAENVDVLLGSFSPWEHVIFTTDGNSGSLKISDLYIADGSGEQDFLGPVNSTRLFPAKETEMGWAPSLRSKKYLIVLGGQSNVNGRGSISPYTASPPSPNSKVFLFYPTVGPPYSGIFSDVIAGIGAHPFDNPTAPTLYWSFEMSLAEEIANFYALSDDPARTEVYIVRLGKDASSIIPLPDPNDTWHPSVPNSLSIRGMQILDAAAAAVGGWSAFDEVDFFWYQGESEALAAAILPAGILNFVPWTLDVFGYFEAAIGKPVNWHRMLVQTEMLAVFTHLQEVRAQQRSPLLPGPYIETADLPIGPDGVHMSEDGQVELGRRAFASWKSVRNFADNLKDFLGLPAEDSWLAPHWVGAASAGASCSFVQAPELKADLMHTPVIALNNKMRRESGADGKRLQMTVGDVSLPVIVLDNASAWTFKYLQLEAVAVPEQVTGELGMKLI